MNKWREPYHNDVKADYKSRGIEINEGFLKYCDIKSYMKLKDSYLLTDDENKWEEQ